MKELNNCKKCFKIAMINKEIGLCDECYDKEVDQVKAYLYEHPGALVSDVAKDLNKKIALINYMIKDYRIMEEGSFKELKDRESLAAYKKSLESVKHGLTNDHVGMRFIDVSRKR